ncbi:TIGR02391 family protein [Halobium salinum]|uniref:TIGR02391 family protein n=1 Tax=Halobium salinum TaxID=1364940 RepID=A0ABD5PFF1_9EURY|nr:TIGR02391 family protein [Halobium salinum]
MNPSIRFHETADEDGPQDRKNGEKLLNFLDEVRQGAEKGNTIDSLHDGELIERCLPLFEQGKYPEAARLAGQILEERVDDVPIESLENFGGTNLMHQAFSPDGGPVRLASENSEQKGLMYLFAGAYLAIRNPLSHRTPDPERNRYLDQIDRNQSRNAIHTIDFLLTVLERYSNID